MEEGTLTSYREPPTRNYHREIMEERDRLREEVGEWQQAAEVEASLRREFMAERDRLRLQTEWQPIETAPRNGKPMLLWWRTTNRPSVGAFEDDGFRDGWRCDGDQIIPINQEDCTHWMPLPSAPQANEN